MIVLRWLARDMGLPELSPAQLLGFILAAIVLAVIGWAIVVAILALP